MDFMGWLKRLLLVGLLALAPSAAFAQCNGIFPANNVCGTVGGGFAGPVPSSSFASAITVGVTPISGGITGYVLYDNGGILGNYPITGTAGNVVLSTSPTISGLTVTGSLTATGLVTNADLANPATTVNGQTCTLGSTCTVTAVASSLVVGTTIISSGTPGNIEYNNGGVLGEKGVTGTGSVVLASSPSIASLTVTTGFTATGLVTAADLFGTSGTGNVVLVTSPTLVTPTLGAASATSLTVTGSTDTTSGSTGSINTVGGIGITKALFVGTSGTFGTQQTTQGSLILANTAAGAYATTIQSSNSASAAATYTLPTAAPAGNGYSLTASTAGVMSWTNVGGGGGTPCTTTASSIQYDAAGSFGCVSGVTSNGTAMTFANGDLILAGSSSGSSALETSATGGGTITFQAGAHTVASTTLVDQTLSGGANVTPYQATISGSALTVDCGKGPLQYVFNTGAFTLTAPTSDGSCVLEVINASGSSSNPNGGAITLAGNFSVKSPVGVAFANTLTQSAVSCTVTSASPGVITWTAHGLTANTPIYLTGTTAPTGLTKDVVYYVVGSAITTNTIEISATPGGAAINTSSTGTSVTCNEPSVYDLSLTSINNSVLGVWAQVQ